MEKGKTMTKTCMQWSRDRACRRVRRRLPHVPDETVRGSYKPCIHCGAMVYTGEYEAETGHAIYEEFIAAQEEKG